MSGEGEVLASDKGGLQNALKELHPPLTRVRHDKVSVIGVFAFDFDTSLDLWELIYVLSLDVKAHPRAKHKHLERPSKGADRVINDYKSTILK